ncbi:uncharacterized protein TNCV_443521 [Trichonephila clavipes]|nr:uncharacterized protein TNCV_443521 [Trichonephila clavipes]
MTSSKTEITTLNRKRGNIKCQLTKMANALQKQIDLSIPELQAKLYIVLKLEEKFEQLKSDYYKITNETEYAYAESVLNSMEDDLQDFERCFLAKNLEALNKTLANFWEIEDVEPQEICNRDELIYCTEHFAKTHTRKADDKYVVSMPLKPELPETILGNSKMIASKRLDQLWTRLERDLTMRALYSEFLNEYVSLHHMREVKEDSKSEAGYYLPHQGILRPDNMTTKLRVVFYASAKTTSGYSLNDLLYKGGVLQEDMFSILIRFRKHISAFTADIKQMVRMFELNESQTRLQKSCGKLARHFLLKYMNCELSHTTQQMLRTWQPRFCSNSL